MVSRMDKKNDGLKNARWDKSSFCYIGLPLINHFNNNASPNAAVIIYTLFFFLMGDISNKIVHLKRPLEFMYFLIDNKPWLLIFFSLMFGLNIMAEKGYKCNYYDELNYFVGGGLIGLFSGILLMLLFLGLGMKKLLHTNTFLQDSTFCTLPSKKLFRCNTSSNKDTAVYFLQDGETIDDIYIDKILPGDVDSYNISTLKNYGKYNSIMMTGKIAVFFYEKPDRKGQMIKIGFDGYMEGKKKSKAVYIAMMSEAAKEPALARTMTDTELAKKAEELEQQDRMASNTSSPPTGPRHIYWQDLVNRFIKDWPDLKDTFNGPKSIMIQKEY